MATNIELERLVIKLQAQVDKLQAQIEAMNQQIEDAALRRALNLFFDQAREGREWTAAKRAVGVLEPTSEPELPLAETSPISYEEQRKAESDHNMRALLKSCGSSEAVIEQVLKV